MLDAYGDIILRGWREAAGSCLPEIESSLIQVCRREWEGEHSRVRAEACAPCTRYYP